MQIPVWAACGVIIFFLAGCIDAEFTGGDRTRCLDAAQAGVNRIPVCTDEQSCETEFQMHPGLISSTDFETQTNLFQVQKKIVSSWAALNQVETKIKKTQEACRSGNIPQVFTTGIEMAGRIKTALNASEQAALSAQRALESAGVHGHRLELEKVRDSNAFEGYTRVLEVLQEWQAGSGTHAETLDAEESNAYFERVAQAITKNDIQPYQLDWKNAFGIYETILKKNKSSAAPTILVFSPVWQSAVSSFSSGSRTEHTLALAEEIRIPEMVNNIEENVSPDNGVVFRWMERIKKMEEGIEQLAKEENELENQLKIEGDSLFQAEKNRDELENTINEWKMIVNTHAAMQPKQTEANEYDSLTAGGEKIRALLARWSELHTQRTENDGTLGGRVAEWRKLKLKMGSAREDAIRKDEINENWILQCRDWAKSVEKSGVSNTEIRSKTNEALREGTPPERASRCGEFVVAMKNHSAQTGKKEESTRILLVHCANLRARFADALELESDGETADYFEMEFGLNAGLHACEASRIRLEDEYNDLPDVQDWQALTQEVDEKISALNFAVHAHPEITPPNQSTHFPAVQEWRLEENNPLVQDERKSKLEKLQGALEIVNGLLDEIIQNSLNAVEWKILSEWVSADEQDEYSLSGEWKNPFGRKVNHAGTYQLPTPLFFEHVESSDSSQLEMGEKGVAWTTDKIPFPGVMWNGSTTGRLVSTTIQEAKVMNVNHTHARMQDVIRIESRLSRAPVAWKWLIPQGVSRESIRVSENDRLIPFTLNGNILFLQEEIPAFPALRIVSYDNPTAIRMKTKSWLPQTNGGETETTYEIELESGLGEEVTTSISTGITGDPVNTTRISASDEEGNALATGRNALWGIILRDVVLQPHEIKKIWIVVHTAEGLANWQAWGQTLLDEVDVIREGGSMALALQAGRLITEIQSGWKERTAEGWAQKLPEWQNRAEKLRADWEQEEWEWASEEAKWSDVQRQLMVHPEWKEINEIKKGVQMAINAKRDGSLPRFKESVMVLDKWIQEKEANHQVQAPKANVGKMGVTLQEVQETINAWKEKLAEYSLARALTCDKLAQTGFTCPIGADKESQMLKEAKEIQSLTGKDAKKWEIKSTPDQEAWAMERESQWMDWKMRAEKGKELTESGLGAIRNTAKDLLEEIASKEKMETPEVQSAISKARIAFENKEFGKTIFIAKSLRAYWQEKAPFTGLATLPPLLWPFLGLAMVLGGVWWHQKWKNGKKIEAIPISIPRANEETREEPMHPENEKWVGGDVFQSMQAENRSGQKGQAEAETRLPREQSGSGTRKENTGSTLHQKKRQQKATQHP